MSVLGKLEIPDVTVNWKIEKFSLIDTTVGAEVISPVFDMRFPPLKKLRWQLVLFPGGFNEYNKEHVALCLRYLGEHQISATYSFSLLDDKSNKVNQFTPKEDSTYKKNRTLGTSKYCLKSELLRVVTKDTLVISCTIIVRSMELDDEKYDVDESARAHFESILESGDLSDVTFEIGDKKMQLHKAIVASLSPVFLAMFQHEMREKEESVVQIPDVKYEVMRELFRYIYVRKVNDIENIAMDLLVAADKYDVQGLKILCENVLSCDINADNALKQMELSLTYNTTILKSKATEFVASRLDEFVDKPEFQKMTETCKDELLRAIARNKAKTDN